MKKTTNPANLAPQWAPLILKFTLQAPIMQVRGQPLMICAMNKGLDQIFSEVVFSY